MKKTLTTLTAAAMLLSTSVPAFALEEGVVTIWMGAGKGDALLQEAAATSTPIWVLRLKSRLLTPG